MLARYWVSFIESLSCCYLRYRLLFHYLAYFNFIFQLFWFKKYLITLSRTLSYSLSVHFFMASYSLLMDAKASLKMYFGKYIGFTFKSFVTCTVSISSDFCLFWACVLCEMPFSKDQWSLANCKRGVNTLTESSVCIGGICWLTGINLKWLGQVMWQFGSPQIISPQTGLLLSPA